MALRRGLADPDWPVRARLAEVLGAARNRTQGAAELLGSLLDDEDWRVRRAAVRAAAAVALALRSAPDRPVRRFRSPAFEPLVALLDDREALVRGQTARALAILGDRRAVPALRRAMSNRWDGSTAASALWRLGVPVDWPARAGRAAADTRGETGIARRSTM